MIANLRDYEPCIIEFVIPEAIRETFPPVLFEGSTNVDEIIKPGGILYQTGERSSKA